MRRLSEAGLDEIRFHPPYEQWGDLHGTEWEEILHIAREEGLTPAFEIPGIRPKRSSSSSWTRARPSSVTSTSSR